LPEKEEFARDTVRLDQEDVRCDAEEVVLGMEGRSYPKLQSEGCTNQVQKGRVC
jgi:hypothetical protein